MKKIVFLTGTRADFGKLKPLMQATYECDDLRPAIFATGMHILSRYGFTVEEIYKAGFSNIFTYMNQVHGEPMEVALANTILGLSRYVSEFKPDLIVVHGDRVEALAGAIVGSLRKILVAHVEGGELSGAIDELMRHAVSKLSHIHFAANKVAAQRLIQMGERQETIRVIGSPNIDIMLSGNLPTLQDARFRYEISFDEYAIAIYHPVTTDSPKDQKFAADEFVNALEKSGKNYVVVYPNNDEGSDLIMDAYRAFDGSRRYRVIPSLRFEYFLVFLRNASFIIGNSSAGIHEAPVYAVPTINIGTRQNNRFRHESIINVNADCVDILAGIEKIPSIKSILKPCYFYGNGNSSSLFVEALKDPKLWETSTEKQFVDYSYMVNSLLN